MKPARKKKGAGRSHAQKPKAKPAADVDDRERDVVTLQEVAAYLHCHYATPAGLFSGRKFPGSGWAATGSF
jgi:hypothetical protein